jgi:hypothetical protein
VALPGIVWSALYLQATRPGNHTGVRYRHTNIRKKVLNQGFWLQDNAIVKFATTIHRGNEWVIRERKKPRDTSSSALVVKILLKLFPSAEPKNLPK